MSKFNLTKNVKCQKDKCRNIDTINYLMFNAFRYAHQRECNEYISFLVTPLVIMSKFKS